ncbi:MAG: hypothetical protein ACMVO3_00105 [Thalassobaculum sp.]
MRRWSLDGRLAAFALAEIVDENMANAARVHAIEEHISARAMIAFGGARLHAARLAEKLDIHTIVVRPAGVARPSASARAGVLDEVVQL